MPVLCDNMLFWHLERPDEATCAGRKDSRTQRLRDSGTQGLKDSGTQGLRDSRTLDPVGERNLIMAIAIEDVVTLLDQLREGLVEMRGYL
jgi:hypothetical protein